MTLLTLFRHAKQAKPKAGPIVLDTSVLGDAFKPARIRPSCVPVRPPAYRRVDSDGPTLKAA